MGGSSSKYKMAVGSQPANPNLDWIALPNAKITPLKPEGFINAFALGKGKFGMVFLAKQAARESSLHVAIKYIPKQTIYESKGMARMQQEMNALQICDHPFIAHCFGGFETPTCAAIVLDFCYGGELYHRIQTVHKMAEQEAKFYFCEIASALHYLHDELNMVYRDLKPENILLDREGHVRLCDFGFAATVEHSATGSAAAPLQDGCGTVMYMAPELAGKTPGLTHGLPVDWWALGCVLFELVTGEAPFGNTESMSRYEVFNRITEKSPPYPFFMSFNLKSLIRGLLEKDSSKRWAYDQVAACPWMKDVNWMDLEARKIRPPWVPTADSPLVNACNFLSWPNVTLPTGTVSSGALAYCKDLRFPPPRSSNRAYTNGRGILARSNSTSAAGDSNKGRNSRQGSKKVVPTVGDIEEGIESPVAQNSRKRTTDSLILTKDKNKQKHAQAEGANSDGRNSPTKGTEGALNGARTGDSVKLTKERSKANLAKEKSRVASVKE